MKWLRKITGIQELIEETKVTNDLLRDLNYQLKNNIDKGKIPRHKG